MDSGGWGLFFIVALALVFVSRPFVSGYIIRRRRADEWTGRKVAWAYGLTVALPYIALLLMALVAVPGAAPLLLLVMALTVPVYLIAWVALYRSSEPDSGPSGPE